MWWVVYFPPTRPKLLDVSIYLSKNARAQERMERRGQRQHKVMLTLLLNPRPTRSSLTQICHSPERPFQLWQEWYHLLSLSG